MAGFNSHNSQNNINGQPGEDKITSIEQGCKNALMKNYRDFLGLNDAEKNKLTLGSTATGNAKMREQFWNYLVKNKGNNILDTVDKELFEVNMPAIEKKFEGIKLSAIADDADSNLIRKQLSSGISESEAIVISLTDFRKFCDTKAQVTQGTTQVALFSAFATYAGISLDAAGNPEEPTSTSKIKNIEDINSVWEDFIAQKGIKLGADSLAKAKAKLNGATNSFDFTERMMMTTLIKKISSKLAKNKPLKAIFDRDPIFDPNVYSYSALQSLEDFHDKWQIFLNNHRGLIDDATKAELNGVIVSNMDIRKEMMNANIVDQAGTKGRFSEWNIRLKTVVGKLVSAEYFRDFQESQDLFDSTIESVETTFKEFPPYFNQILKIYPCDEKTLENVPGSNIASINSQINTIVSSLQNTAITPTAKITLEEDLAALKKKLEEEKRNSYIKSIVSGPNSDPKLSSIIAELVGTNFDFSKLSKSDQQRLINTLVSNSIQDSVANEVPTILGYKPDDFKTFIKELFDIQNNAAVKVPYGGRIYKLEFLAKEFVGGPRKNPVNIADMANLQNLPLNFKIKPTKDSIEFFENTDLWENIFNDFTDSSGVTQKVNDSYQVELEKDGAKFAGYLSSYGSAANDNGDNLYLYSEPVNSPFGLERKAIKDSTGKPIVIKKDQEKDYKLNILNKEINLNGNLIGQLLFGHVLGNSSVEKKEKMSPKTKEFLENQMKKGGAFEGYTDAADNYPEDVQAKEKAKQELKPAEDTQRANADVGVDEFTRAWEGLSGDKSVKFEPGAKILFETGPSELPPKMNPGPQFVQLEIVRVSEGSKKFTVKANGCELKLSNAKDAKLKEGKELDFDMSPKTIENWKKGFKNMVFKMPNPKVGDFNQQLAVVRAAGLKLPGLKMFEKQVNFRSGDFFFNSSIDQKQKGNEPVKYFGSREYDVSKTDIIKPDKECVYEVKHNSDHTFTVTTKFIGKDKEPLGYEQRMDYQNFIIFIAGKDLTPQSKESAELTQDEINKSGNTIKEKGKWFTIGNVVGIVKNGRKGLQDKKKKKKEGKTEELMDHVFTGKDGLYKKLSGLPGVGGSFLELHYEYNKDRDNRTWSKIKYWKDLFLDDPDPGFAFPNYVEPLLTGKKKPEDRFQMAGAFLAMIKRGGPYMRCCREWMGKGRRIEMLFGPGHLAKFLALQKKTKEDLDKTYYSDQERSANTDKLVKLEMTYIIDEIGGGQYSDQDQYKDQQATRRSKQFGKEVETLYGELTNTSKIKETFDANAGVNFEYAESEYKKFLNSGRVDKAIGWYKRMAGSIMRPYQKKAFVMHTMALLTSGIVTTSLPYLSRVAILKICRTAGINIGILDRSPKIQAYTASFLDMATDGSFSKKNINNIAKTKDGQRDYDFSTMTHEDMSGVYALGKNDGFLKAFEAWWNEGSNGSEVMNFLDASSGSLIKKLHSPDLSTLEKETLTSIESKMVEGKQETVDEDLWQGHGLYKDTPLNVSSALIGDLLRLINRGSFEGDDGRVEAAREFFPSLTNAVNANAVDLSNNKEMLSFMIKKFFNTFERVYEGSKRFQFIRALKAAKQNPEKAREILGYLIGGQCVVQWQGLPTEIEDLTKAFEDLFIANLKNIDSNVIASSFPSLGSKAATLFDKSNMLYVDEAEYESVIRGPARTPEAVAKKREYDNPNRYINTVTSGIKANMRRLNEVFGESYEDNLNLQEEDDEEEVNESIDGGSSENTRTTDSGSAGRMSPRSKKKPRVALGG